MTIEAGPDVLERIHRFDHRTKAEIARLLEEKARLAKLQEAREHFLPFVRMVWPGFIPGAHHTIMAEAFERVANGTCTRLIVNIAPRHTKSEFASYLLPSWFLGRFPDKKIIQASNTEALAAGFGRKVRNLVSREDKVSDMHGPDPYHEIFPDVTLAKDSQAASSWHTNKGGEYFAIGVNGRVTGKGGDIIIIDDPHDEQEAKQAAARPEIFDSVTEWFYSGPRQRLQPGGAIIVVMTRWSRRDLTGQVIDKMVRAQNDNTDQWEIIELPAILDEGLPTERSLWPAYWKLETLQATRSVLPVSHWQAQYLQKPTSEEGAIIKKEYWRKWGEDGQPAPSPNVHNAWHGIGNKEGLPEAPACQYVLQSWDTAMTKNTRSDYSACVTFGVFDCEDRTTGKVVPNLILLDAWKGRLGFPELKAWVKEMHSRHAPDMLLIENKGSGISLIQEIRSMGLPVQDFSYGRGTKKAPNDKVARANMVADVFASGYVWAPEFRWAEEVITECAEFPFGDHDDYCFVAGTKIATRRGPVSIETISLRDEVLTPDGWCKITSVSFTGRRTVINWLGLTGTPDHPVFTLDAGYQALYEIGDDSNLVRLSLCGLLKTALLKSWFSTASVIDGWEEGVSITYLNPPVMKGGGLLRACMSLFGSMLQERQYQKASKFITKIATLSISSLTIWIAYQKVCIVACLRKLTLPSKKSYSPKFDLSQSNGINLKKVVRGIGHTLLKLSGVLDVSRIMLQLSKPEFVYGAEMSSKLKFSNGGSAERPVNGRNLVSGGVNTPMSTPTIKRDVYNLTVEGAHCYFADGVLVHNCDAVVQAITRFRDGNLIATANDDDSWADEPIRRRRGRMY